jgi:hypothetical protein
VTEAQHRLALARACSAILRAANCDTLSGAKKDREYKSNRRAEQRIAHQRLREKRMKLGTLGAASPVRSVK